MPILVHVFWGPIGSGLCCEGSERDRERERGAYAYRLISHSLLVGAAVPRARAKEGYPVVN